MLPIGYSLTILEIISLNISLTGFKALAPALPNFSILSFSTSASTLSLAFFSSALSLYSYSIYSLILTSSCSRKAYVSIFPDFSRSISLYLSFSFSLSSYFALISFCKSKAFCLASWGVSVLLGPETINKGSLKSAAVLFSSIHFRAASTPEF